MKNVLTYFGAAIVLIGGIIFFGDVLLGFFEIPNFTSLSDDKFMFSKSVIPMVIGAVIFLGGVYWPKAPTGRIEKARMAGKKFFLMSLTVIFLASCAGPQKGFDYGKHNKNNKKSVKKAEKKRSGKSLINYKCNQR